MSLYAIADLHLSLGVDKPMDIFKGWQDYEKRLKSNWNSLIDEDDTVMIAGDISWAMKLDECYEDFSFINSLNGKKIISKGNHDYWWMTKRKLDNYLLENKFDTISFLFNNAFSVDDFAVCGSRGWYFDADTQQDKKVIMREVGRLKLSIEEGLKLNKKPIVFLHYPPVYNNVECVEIMDTLREYEIQECYYGHLHGTNTHKCATVGEYSGINFHLISSDYLGFMPKLVR